MELERKSPTERPTLPQVKSPSTIQGRLKSFFPEAPLDPPDEIEDDDDAGMFTEEYDAEENHDYRP